VNQFLEWHGDKEWNDPKHLFCKSIAGELAAIRAEEMELACKDVCQGCASVKYNLYQDEFGRFKHINKSDETLFWICDANAIRQRWQQAQKK
jgi:hypothetical protein